LSPKIVAARGPNRELGRLPSHGARALPALPEDMELGSDTSVETRDPPVVSVAVEDTVTARTGLLRPTTP
jgi:hypothetical protein